jgi:hypothetical protein
MNLTPVLSIILQINVISVTFSFLIPSGLDEYGITNGKLTLMVLVSLVLNE